MNTISSMRLLAKPLTVILLLVAPLSMTALLQLPISAVPQQVQQLLNTNAPDQWWFRTHLTTGADPSEYFAVYQPSRERMAFDPHVAWIKGGTLRFQEELDPDAEFAGAREFRLDQRRNALAVAFHFAGDRSGTWFRIYATEGETLKLLQDFQVVEGQLEIVESPSGARLQIWQEAGPCNSGEAFCVWCLHRYRIDEYRWSGANTSTDFRTASTTSFTRLFYLLSRHDEQGCRDPKLFHKEPIVGVRAPVSVSNGIEGEP